MIEWVESHPWLLVGLGIVSVVVLVATFLVGVLTIVRLPHDYLLHPEADHDPSRPKVVGLGRQLLRKGLGLLLVCAGIAMLVLPGQGLLTIALGLVLLGLPGAHGFSRRLLARPRVRRGANHIRRWCGREPLACESDRHAGAEESTRSSRDPESDQPPNTRSTTIGR